MKGVDDPNLRHHQPAGAAVEQRRHGVRVDDVDLALLYRLTEFERRQVVHVALPLAREYEHVDSIAQQFFAYGTAESPCAADADVEPLAVDAARQLADNDLGAAET